MSLGSMLSHVRIRIAAQGQIASFGLVCGPTDRSIDLLVHHRHEDIKVMGKHFRMHLRRRQEPATICG